MNSFLEQYLPEGYKQATYKGIPYKKQTELDKRNASYQRRRAEGNPHPNPFAFLNEPIEGQKNYHDPAHYGAPADGGFLVDIKNKMAENSKGGIYEGLGENLGEDIIYDKVDAITGEERDSPNVTNIPLMPEGTGNALWNMFSGSNTAQAAEAPDPEALNLLGIKEPPVMPEKSITPKTTIADLHEIEVTAKRREDVQTQNALIAQGAEGIIKAGGGEKELKGWGKFSKEFDLQALGMALLATSGNGEGLLPNLGQALMYSKATREAQEDREIAAEAAYRKEGREERKVTVQEAEVLRKAAEDEQQAKANAANAHSRRQSAEASARGAAASELRAQAAMESALNPKSTSIPSDIKAYSRIGAGQAYPGMDKKSVEMLGDSISGALAEEARAAKAAGIPFNIAERAKALAAAQGATIVEDGWFSSPSIPGFD